MRMYIARESQYTGEPIYVGSWRLSVLQHDGVACRIKAMNYDARAPFCLDTVQFMGEDVGRVTSIDQPYAPQVFIYGKDAIYGDTKTFSYVEPKTRPQKGLGQANGEIVVNNDYRYTVKWREVPKPLEKGTNRSIWLEDPSATAVTGRRCGNGVTSVALERAFPGMDYDTGRTGEFRWQAGYVEHTEFVPFKESFTDADARDLAGKLCPWVVDTGTVTSTVSEMNSKTWDIAAELGELPETVKMVYDACKGVIKMKKTTQRKVQELAFSDRNSVQIADATASLWMAYRYGLSPIALSIESALEALRFKNYGLYQTVRKGFREQYTIEDEGFRRIAVTRHGRSFMKSRFSADTSRFARGLRFDIVPALWEIAPLSFVTDWFLNVGDVLSASTPPDIDRTDVNMYSNRYDVSFIKETPTSLVIGEIQSYEIRKIRPSEHIGLDWNPNVGLKRKLDAAALSWFAFRQKSP